MRVAFLSDIHGNAVALEAVLRDIKSKNVDQIAVLGDIAYRGPEPQRSIELVRGLNAKVIKGNADEWTVRGVKQGEVPADKLAMMNRERDWIVERLCRAELEFLQGLPEQLDLELSDSIKAHAFHATPDSLFEVVLPDAPSQVMTEKLIRTSDAVLYVYAHIHLPYIRYTGGKCIVNTGSVGLPFDGLTKASYAIVEADEDRFSVTIERVSYDIERVVAQYKDGDYPNWEAMSRVVREAVSPFAG